MKFLLIAFVSFIISLAFFAVGRMDSPQSNYLPSPDEIQAMINERLPDGYRIRQDGRIGSNTKRAWEYVLDENKNEEYDAFLKTIKTPEM